MNNSRRLEPRDGYERLKRLEPQDIGFEQQERLFRLTNVLRKPGKIVPTIVSDLRQQLANISPENIDLSDVTNEQREAFKKFSWNSETKSWQYGDDHDHSIEFIQQINELIGIYQIDWLVILYNFIKYNYTLEIIMNTTKRTTMRGQFFQVPLPPGELGQRCTGGGNVKERWEWLLWAVMQLPEIQAYKPPGGLIG